MDRLKCFILASLVTAAPSLADNVPNCKKPADQAAATACATAEADKWDKTLSELLVKMKADGESIDKPKGLTETVDSIATSDLAWTAFRDAECKRQSLEAKGDPAEPMVFQICKTKLIKDRIKQLKQGASE